MAKKGMTIMKTLDRERAREISNYIWSLHFVKETLRVDVAVYDDEQPPIDAYVSKVRYAIKVNPTIKLEDIKQFLLQKGYITD